MAPLSGSAHPAAVFPAREAAEAAVGELRALGLADEHLGVAMREPGSRVFEPDVTREEFHVAGEGALIGVPIGVIAGMTMIALSLPGLGTVGLGGILAAGGVAGALGGGFLGSMIGLAAHNREFAASYGWEDYPLQPGEILVVTRGHDQHEQVTRVLEHNGGTVVDLDNLRESAVS